MERIDTGRLDAIRLWGGSLLVLLLFTVLIMSVFDAFAAAAW